MAKSSLEMYSDVVPIGKQSCPVVIYTEYVHVDCVFFFWLTLCVIDSLFRDPWLPEIFACILLTQHKIDFQHCAFLLQI
jgi:hypothetical protein